MLVSAVLDPAAFDSDYFDALYTIQAVDFLKGIQRNGLLIVDSENRLRDALVKQIKSLPIKPQQRLRSLIEELVLKKRSKRVIACFVSLNDTSSVSLLDLAYHLKTGTKADALIVGKKSLETLKSDRRFSECMVPLSEYRDSNFEKDRQQYENQFGPIDTLPKSEVEDIIIRSVRFSKWLRFYDPYIGRRKNTPDFQKGIKYILSLWNQPGSFASQQGVRSVEIFTCSHRDVQTHVQHQRITQKLIKPLTRRFPLPIHFSIKDDADGIFHARYLETQHAIIRVDRGFDLFKRNGEFRRNFFTLHKAESSHLRECRDLPDAAL